VVEKNKEILINMATIVSEIKLKLRLAIKGFSSKTFTKNGGEPDTISCFGK
jgi:hypothetical protein